MHAGGIETRGDVAEADLGAAAGHVDRSIFTDERQIAVVDGHGDVALGRLGWPGGGGKDQTGHQGGRQNSRMKFHRYLWSGIAVSPEPSLLRRLSGEPGTWRVRAWVDPNGS
jgi:hypothetical protein